MVKCRAQVKFDPACIVYGNATDYNECGFRTRLLHAPRIEDEDKNKRAKQIIDGIKKYMGLHSGK